MTSKTFLGGNLEGDFIFFDGGVDVNGMVAGLFVSFVITKQSTFSHNTCFKPKEKSKVEL